MVGPRTSARPELEVYLVAMKKRPKASAVRGGKARWKNVPEEVKSALMRAAVNRRWKLWRERQKAAVRTVAGATR